MRIINRLQKKKGRMLDIACSTGMLLDIGRKEGWKVEGIELSQWAVDLARKRGHKVQTKKLEDMHFKENSFDLITMFGIIEHVPDPLAFLGEVKRIIAPDGLVVITIPIGNAFKEKVMKKDYYCLQHLTYYTPQTFRMALLKAGFDIIREGPYIRYMKMKDMIKWFQKSRYYPLLKFWFGNDLFGNIPWQYLPDEHVFFVRKCAQKKPGNK